MSLGQEEIGRRLGYHPATDKTRSTHEDLREIYISLATRLDITLEHVGADARNVALAHTALQESLMWANAAVAMTAPLA